MSENVGDPSNCEQRDVFTYLTGQYDNLGDALLRRAMVAELSQMGVWHVYVGTAPNDYISSLELPTEARVYRNARRWFTAAARGMTARGRAVLIVNPGEISSTKIEFVLGTMGALLLMLGKIGRNPGFRLGIGARDRRRPLSVGHEASTRMAAVTVWRDSASRQMYRRGHVAPDWAFALRAWPSAGERRLVALCYRADKPTPSLETLRIVKEWCTSRGLEVVIVTQVSRDFEASERLARALDVAHVGSRSSSLTDVEGLVRSAYSQSLIVLSNRIHALIVAAVDGAVPGAILGHSDVKVERTLTAGHFPTKPLIDSSNRHEVERYLDDLMLSSTGRAAAIAMAVADLEDVSSRVLAYPGNRK